MYISSKDFLAFLAPASFVAKNEGKNKIFNNFYLKSEGDCLSLRSTNLEIAAISIFPLPDNGLPHFEGLIPASQLLNLVKQMPDYFRFVFKDGKLILKTDEDEIKFKFNLGSPDLFPFFDIPEPVASLMFLTENLLSVLESVSTAMPTSEKEYRINGICLDFRESPGYAVATNGFSLAYANLKPVEVRGTLEGEYIIPASAVREFIRVLKLLSQDDSVVLFLHGDFISLACNISGFDYQLAARCIDANFINWKEFLKQNYSASISLNPASTINVLRRIKIIATEYYQTVFFSPRNSGIEVSISVPDVGEAREVFEADISGNFPKIQFNVSLLINALKPLRNESSVIMDFEDDKSPVRIQGQNYVCLIMPVTTN